MFQVNDTVKYGTTGVCRIVDMTVRSISGKEMLYYVLKPVHQDGATVYVPARNEKLLSKMQRILSKQEIDALIEEMPGCGIAWIDQEKTRQETYKKVLDGGDRKELIGLIRTLYQKRQELSAEGKKLRAADEHLMKDAEELLYDEFSTVLGLKPDAIVPYLMDRLAKQEQVSGLEKKEEMNK